MSHNWIIFAFVSCRDLKVFPYFCVTGGFEQLTQLVNVMQRWYEGDVFFSFLNAKPSKGFNLPPKILLTQGFLEICLLQDSDVTAHDAQMT